MKSIEIQLTETNSENAALRANVQQLSGTIARLERELQLLDGVKSQNTELKRAITELRIKHAYADRNRQIKATSLDNFAVARLHAAFKNSTDNAGLKEAINVEVKRASQPTGQSKQDLRVERILG